MIYELWMAVDGTESGLQEADHPMRERLSVDVKGRPMILFASFWARTWSEAKTAYENIINASPENAFLGGASVALAKLYQSEKDNSHARQVLEAFVSREQSSAYAEEANTLLAALH